MRYEITFGHLDSILARLKLKIIIISPINKCADVLATRSVRISVSIFLGVRMRMKPRTAPCRCVCAQCVCGWAMWSRCQKLSRRTTVESEIIYTWLVHEGIHNVLSSFVPYSLLALLASKYFTLTSLHAFSFSVSPTVGCVQHSTPQTRTLRKTSRTVLPVRSSIVKKRRSFLPRMSVHVTNEFLSVHVSPN